MISSKTDAGDSRPAFGLTGRVAVVTGGASGIGLACARTVARAGATVILADIDEQAANRATAALTGMGWQCQPAHVDTSRPETVHALFDKVAAQRGRIDIVFANAGVSMARGPAFVGGGIVDADPAEWRRVMDINLEGTFHTVQAAARNMLPARYGRIVVTASTASLRADLTVSYAYVTSKGALPNLVKQAAAELASHNITVNAIAPGPIRTNIAGGRLHDQTVADRVAAAVPMGRVGEPEELEGVALLLASDASSFITGVTIPVDGGMMAWGGAPRTG